MMDNKQANHAADHGANRTSDHSTRRDTRANHDDTFVMVARMMLLVRESARGSNDQRRAHRNNSDELLHDSLQWHLHRPRASCPTPTP